MRRKFDPPTYDDLPNEVWRPYEDVHRERVRAHALHDDRGQSMERRAADDPLWLPVVTEELGEVAQVLCDDTSKPLDVPHLREELVQLAAMTVAWIDAIDLEESET